MSRRTDGDGGAVDDRFLSPASGVRSSSSCAIPVEGFSDDFFSVSASANARNNNGPGITILAPPT